MQTEGTHSLPFRRGHGLTHQAIAVSGGGCNCFFFSPVLPGKIKQFDEFICFKLLGSTTTCTMVKGMMVLYHVSYHLGVMQRMWLYETIFFIR